MLLALRETLCDQIAQLDRQLTRQAKAIAVCRRFMTVPGVGRRRAVRLGSIDDPGRFAQSPSLAAYFGLTPRRYASGEMNRSGPHHQTRRPHRPYPALRGRERAAGEDQPASALRSWGLAIAQRSGFKKAKVAVARKLAVLLHGSGATAPSSAGVTSPPPPERRGLRSPAVRPRRDDGDERARSPDRRRAAMPDPAHHFAPLASVNANLGRPRAPIP